MTKRTRRRGVSVLAVAMAIWLMLMPQFIVGMGTNLWVHLPEQSATADAMSVPGRIWFSLSWSLTHSPTFLRIHVLIALALVILSLFNFVWTCTKRRTVLILLSFLGFGELMAATINGLFFVLYQYDVNSFIMSIAFVSSVISFAIEIYLLKKAQIE
nr:hypothetical protein [Bacilli bacterium]